MIINDKRLRFLVGRFGGQPFLIIKEIAYTSLDSRMDAKGFAMSSSQSLILLCTRLLFYFIENGK